MCSTFNMTWQGEKFILGNKPGLATIMPSAFVIPIHFRLESESHHENGEEAPAWRIPCSVSSGSTELQEGKGIFHVLPNPSQPNQPSPRTNATPASPGRSLHRPMRWWTDGSDDATAAWLGGFWHALPSETHLFRFTWNFGGLFAFWSLGSLGIVKLGLVILLIHSINKKHVHIRTHSRSHTHSYMLKHTHTLILERMKYYILKFTNALEKLVSIF